ncbi:hypothetical protein [Saccharopolyspora spinosa]|uniref:Uncharacterized protein n=1 Tax=Saccharopolyspora spinosa TaxID=60894 RepID=A0A2N3XZ76_SACSN|nr:hypothetical protein [Saccharopolyspora spinosa]PKW15962.1 hypothetical protein A8926_3744 [Saccharopolyspora spinosa]
MPNGKVHPVDVRAIENPTSEIVSPGTTVYLYLGQEVVTRKGAQEILGVGPKAMREMVSKGRIALFRAGVGRQCDLIEVAELERYRDQMRARGAQERDRRARNAERAQLQRSGRCLSN